MQKLIAHVTNTKSIPASLRFANTSPATYQPEPELNGALPRRTIRRKDYSCISTIMGTVILGLIPILCLWLFFEKYALLPTILLSLLIAGIVATLLKKVSSPSPVQLREKELLENGITRPAAVKRLERTVDKNTYRLTFVYATAGNPRTVESIKLTQKQVTIFASFLKPNQLFTLLINPDNERDMLPYFAADTYRVEGSYLPTQTLSPITTPILTLSSISGAAPTAKPRSAQGPIAAEWGVEPELFCAAPRHVVWKRETVALRAWMMNLALGAVAIAFYCYQNPVDPSSPQFLLVGAGLFFLYTISLLCWGTGESVAAKSRFFLEKGHAARATVDKCEVNTLSNYMDVRYTYLRPKGEIGHGYLHLSIDSANQVGGLVVGTSFTVLVHPAESFTTIPYFQIMGVEIPGAGKASTVPPGTPKP